MKTRWSLASDLDKRYNHHTHLLLWVVRCRDISCEKMPPSKAHLVQNVYLKTGSHNWPFRKHPKENILLSLSLNSTVYWKPCLANERRRKKKTHFEILSFWADTRGGWFRQTLNEVSWLSTEYLFFVTWWKDGCNLVLSILCPVTLYTQTCLYVGVPVPL